MSTRRTTYSTCKETKTWYSNVSPPPPRTPSAQSPPEGFLCSSNEMRPERPPSPVNLVIRQPISRITFEYSSEPEQKSRGDSAREDHQRTAGDRRKKLFLSPPRPRVRPCSPDSSDGSDTESTDSLSPRDAAFDAAFGPLTTRMRLRGGREHTGLTKHEGKWDRGRRPSDNRRAPQVFIGNDGHRYIRED